MMPDQAVKLLKELRNAVDDITVVDSESGKRIFSKEVDTDLNDDIGFILEKVDSFFSESHEIQIIQVCCPQCKTGYDIAENLVGRMATCERCGTDFQAEPEHKTPFTKTVLFQDSDAIKLIKSEYEKSTKKKWWQFWK